MGKVYMCGGSGGVKSDDVTASKGDIIKGKTAVTSDSNDEVVAGTLELTGNAAAGDVIKGKTFYSTNPKSKVTGTLALSGNATAANIRKGKTAYITDPKTKVTGTMAEQGGSTTVPGTVNKTIVAANRFVTGNIIVSGDANLKAANIKKGVTIFGVKGTHDGWVPGSGDIYKLGTMGLMTGCTAIRPGSPNYDNWIMGITCTRYYETGNIRLVNGCHDSIVIDNAINLAGWSKINVEASWTSSYSSSTDFEIGIRSTKVMYFDPVLYENDVPFEAKVTDSVALDPHPTKNIVSLDITNINGNRYIYFQASGFGGSRDDTFENTTYIHRIWLS